MKVLDLILTYLFGQKYYTNIYYRRGCTLCEASSRIHKTEASARYERMRILGNPTFQYLDTVSFRTKQPIPQVFDDLTPEEQKHSQLSYEL